MKRPVDAVSAISPYSRTRKTRSPARRRASRCNKMCGPGLSLAHCKCSAEVFNRTAVPSPMPSSLRTRSMAIAVRIMEKHQPGSFWVEAVKVKKYVPVTGTVKTPLVKFMASPTLTFSTSNVITWSRNGCWQKWTPNVDQRYRHGRYNFENQKELSTCGAGTPCNSATSK